MENGYLPPARRIVVGFGDYERRGHCLKAGGIVWDQLLSWPSGCMYVSVHHDSGSGCRVL